jgi:IclR family pca regulon transcriptional regulator
MAKVPRAEFVASLERGLRVLQTFSRENPQLTLSEVAPSPELTPATARRSLHTLEMLGYIGRNGRRFLLRPRVLAIGAGYLSAINAEIVLQPFLQEIVNEVGGSASVTVLDETDIVYIAHASLNRAIRLTAGAGSRYPVYPTSMGRVLMAFQPETVVTAYFRQATFQKLTAHTETEPAALRRHPGRRPDQGLRRHPGRARLRHRLGGAADFRLERARSSPPRTAPTSPIAWIATR